MVRSFDDIRLILEKIARLILVTFIMGICMVSAFMVGWAMALGMGIVFVLSLIQTLKES